MFHNRITSFADYSTNFVSAGHADSIYGSQGGATVMVTWCSLANWQQELYRLAYEQALLDTARPRHERLISWN